MAEQSITRIVLHPFGSTIVYYDHSASYSESETVAASRMSPGTIRYLRTQGFIQGVNESGQQRYSAAEIAQLRQIRRLQRDLGVNMAGVEVILHLLKHVRDLHMELEQERRKHEH